MGAYLSEPNINKQSLDDSNEKVGYGASSMQGWRLEQEDAHNAILDFDTKTSFFAVYDGHGGSEVAAYCAKYLPAFLKTLEEYEKNDLEAALKKLFLKFDESLLTENAMKELTVMRDDESVADEEEEQEKNKEATTENLVKKAETDENEAEPKQPDSTTDNCDDETAQLYDEACMPLEEVLKRYTNTEKKVKKSLEKNNLKGANSAHLSPMITAPGSSAARKSRIKRHLKTSQSEDEKLQTTPPPPAKSKAELDQQEEIDISEIKKNGSVEQNGDENCELDCDEASNLCDLTDSQKSDSVTNTSASNEVTTSAAANTDEPSDQAQVKSTSNSLPNPSALDTPNTKQRLKIRQEELKLSPIRNKSLSSSSLCDDALSQTNNDTVVTAEQCVANKNDLEVPTSSDLTTCKNEENKENNIFNSSDNVEQKKTKENESEEQTVVTTTTKSKKNKSDSNLIAKLIAGVINKKIRQSSKSNKKEDEADLNDDEEEDDDDFDADFDGESEDEEDESEEESGEDDDDETDESSDDEDYESDDEAEEEDDDYPAAETGVSKPGYDSGCTAVVALLQDKKLFVANAGDSRCIVCRDGKAIDMSYDHKPEDEIERERVEKAGGQVTKDGRINNGLNLSRAIGDHTYKQNKDLPLSDQMITSLPDILTLDIDTEKDKFMVLACDGIWNFMSSQDVCDYIQERLDVNYAKLSQICEELFMHCLAPNSEGDGTGCDNMTCILVTFQPFKKVELKFNKNGSVNSEVVEQDKNGLKRTFENAAGNNVTNTTKKLKQEEEAGVTTETS